jgi:hypothetical protein
MKTKDVDYAFKNFGLGWRNVPQTLNDRCAPWPGWVSAGGLEDSTGFVHTL